MRNKFTKKNIEIFSRDSTIEAMGSADIQPSVFEEKSVYGLFSQPFIDIALIAHTRKCPNPSHEECCLDASKIVLYGSWIVQANGKYHPDINGTFSAVHDRLLCIVKVLYSTSLINCKRLLETTMAIGEIPGDCVAFALPPYFYTDEWLQKNADRMIVNGKQYSYLKHQMVQRTRNIESQS